MALVSPGVQVTVIDESFYTPAEPGTTPLIVVATGQDKLNGAGTGTAQGTLKANAGKAFRMTSQRDVVDFFGVPFFEKTPGSSPIHGSERNEYGLLAAYSFMGVSAGAFIVRADVDLNQLTGNPIQPGSEPEDGTWWVDTNDTSYGIQEWNNALPGAGGQKFTTKFPIILTADDSTKLDSNVPKDSVGSVGDYCVVFERGSLGEEFKESGKIYYKSAGNPDLGVAAGEWVLVGTNEWVASHPTVSPIPNTSGNPALTNTDSIEINGTVITGIGTSLGSLAAKINEAGPSDLNLIAGVSAKVINNRLFLFSNGATEADSDSTKSGHIIIGAASTPALLLQLGYVVGDYFPPQLQMSPHTDVPPWKRNQAYPFVQGSNVTIQSNPRGAPTGSVWIKTTEPGGGARFRVKRWNSANQAWQAVESPIYSTGHDAVFFLDRAGGGANISVDALFTQSNPTEHYSYRDFDTEPSEIIFDTTLTTAEFRMFRRAVLGPVTAVSAVIGDTGIAANGITRTFEIKQSVKGSKPLSRATSIVVTMTGTADDAEQMAKAINGAEFFSSTGEPIANRVQASVTVQNQVAVTHLDGGEIRITEIGAASFSALFIPFNAYANTGTANFYSLPPGADENTTGSNGFLISGWKPLASEGFYPQNGEPLDEPFDGQLWYTPNFADVDIMIHNGNTWVGYRDDSSPYAEVNTGRKGFVPMVSASNPYEQGTTVEGDIWVSTADLENYPTIYRYDPNLSGPAANKWALIDKTDQITDEGILFSDARYGLSGATGDVAGALADLARSNYLDPDAPDPALYPRGMLLWNLRRSGGNVKRYANNYINQGQDNPRFDATNSPLGQTYVAGQSMAGYSTDRWVTASPNNEDGSGSFGRKAQRKVVVMAMKSVIDTSEEARDTERRNFNLMAAPGYPEVLSNLINLNIDRGLLAFVLGDTPLRLKSDATTLINWGTNANLVFDNGDDGIVSFDEYCAVYYPNGFTTDLGGSNAVVPATHMMLRTIALSDQVSYPWFAPAGTRRGGITNATAVGYIDSLSGEFQTVALNEGTRDVLYDLKVNPIPFFVGVGLVAYGQKTRARNASALDRINVARLVVYLRSQLQKLARPYIFEPNDQITRDEIKGAVESLLLELVGLRALFDFAVVCDESNNTPSRIDRNELYVDIAIEPVKAVEFIYIPLRIKNTGEI
jgi:hypothetical protein